MSDNNRPIMATESLAEVVQSILDRVDDYRGVGFRKYFSIAKDVYRDLNLMSIRWTKRYLMEVDKQTNSIKLPSDFLLLSSISIVDENGRIIPLDINNNITEDFVDVSAGRHCGCKCGCNNELCGQVKNYEVVYGKVSAPMPNGTMQQFDTYSRKTIYPNGDYYHEYSIPVTEYADGEIVSTTLQEKKEFICKLETEECGCVKNCQPNIDKLNECCGPNLFAVECGCDLTKYCSSPLTYGYENFSDRITFDSEFKYDHVLLRYYVNSNGGDIRVPVIARMGIIYGVMLQGIPFEKVTGYSALAQQRRQIQFERLYEAEKINIFRILNRLSLKKFLGTISPKRRMV